MKRARALRAGAFIAAYAADRALGEPPAACHPVAWFGRAMTRAEPVVWADRRRSGVAYAAAGTGGAALLGLALARGGPGRRSLALAGSLYVALASRALVEAATDVKDALDAGDLGEARHRLRSLVGRRTEDLDEAEIVRAVVESLAENTVDAVTAPLFWGVVAGPAGVLGYRAVNTLDAMVGHRSPRYARFGWASARADDVANWLPARITAALIAALVPGQARKVWSAVRGQAPAHPSPNAGMAEGAFAAALGLRLGGLNDYAGRVERRPQLGQGRLPVRADIDRACRLATRAGAAMALASAGAAVVAGAR